MRYLVIFLIYSGVILTSAERRTEVPEYERPLVKYVKADFNCIDKVMRLSPNKYMRAFYDVLNESLLDYLKSVKTNKVPGKELQSTAVVLRQEYIAFRKNYTVSAKKCLNWLSYINLNATVNCTENMLGLFAVFSDPQFKGKQKILQIKTSRNHFFLK